MHITKIRIWTWSLTYLINFKDFWEALWNPTEKRDYWWIWELPKLSTNMDRQKMQCINIIWMHYHICYYTHYHILSVICLILCYLQQVTTCFCQFFKKLIDIFFINLTVPHGNPLQIAPNHAKLRENVWYHMW